MAKVRVKGVEAMVDQTAAETPTQQVVKAAGKTTLVTDSLGRHIQIRKLNALQRMRLHEVVGSAAGNMQYMGIAGLAVCVTAIDGESIAFPTTKRELEAIVQRLDDEGLAAIGEGMQKMLGLSVDDEGNVYNEAGDLLHAAKN